MLHKRILMIAHRKFGGTKGHPRPHLRNDSRGGPTVLGRKAKTCMMGAGNTPWFRIWF